MIIFPFATQNNTIVVFCIWLSAIMAVVLVLAGLWSCITLLFTPDAPDLQPAERLSETLLTLVVTLFLGTVMFFTAWIVTSLGSTSWFSYDVLRSLGLLSYIVLGSLPVVAYVLVLHAVATRQVITSLKWFIVTIISMLVSLFAPWFWVGFKVYSDYHVL
jgi:hypothetical protein